MILVCQLMNQVKIKKNKTVSVDLLWSTIEVVIRVFSRIDLIVQVIHVKYKKSNEVHRHNT